MFLVVFLIVILMVYLMYDSGLIKGLKRSGKSAADRMGQIRDRKEVKVANGPVLQVKNPDGHGYCKVEVTRKEFKIGRGKNNDLILNDKTVEERHAVIVKKMRGELVFYELINYAKTNPVEYYNKQKNAYEYLRYKDGVELDAREAFYIGNTKIVVTIPVAAHIPSDTEYMQRTEGTDTSEYRIHRSSGSSVFGREEIHI